ncbi:MAG TPA: hypothetical protein VK272_13135 [Solirubrobacteraceae bacterium]|nr:hypothetical protein [Solirubrobacteraceae bacterium]
MTRRLALPRGPLLLACAAVVLTALATAPTHNALAGFGGALAYLLPPLLLALALALRRYPGERALLALIGRSAHRRTHAALEATTSRSRPRALVARGGCLIASSLAVRPPPARVAVFLS